MTAKKKTIPKEINWVFASHTCDIARVVADDNAWPYHFRTCQSYESTTIKWFRASEIPNFAEESESQKQDSSLIGKMARLLGGVPPEWVFYPASGSTERREQYNNWLTNNDSTTFENFNFETGEWEACDLKV